MSRSKCIKNQVVRGLAGASPAISPPSLPVLTESMNDLQAYLTLGQASKLAPGNPSTNCIWRWCRRGVLARSRQRIRLRHIRAGGKVMTTAAWIAEFCSTLAKADAAYFEAKDAAAVSLPPRDARFAPPSSSKSRFAPAAGKTKDEDEQIERELESEGL